MGRRGRMGRRTREGRMGRRGRRGRGGRRGRKVRQVGQVGWVGEVGPGKQILTSPVNTKHDSQQVVTFSSSTEFSSIGTDAQNASSSPPPQLANISPYREDMQHVNSSKQSYNFTDTLTSKFTSSPTISRLNTLPPSPT